MKLCTAGPSPRPHPRFKILLKPVPCTELSSWAADTADSYENAAFYLEGESFDLCGGHSSPDGNYHYHNTAGCLQEQAMIAAGTTADDHSPQIGWAYVSGLLCCRYGGLTVW